MSKDRLQSLSLSTGPKLQLLLRVASIRCDHVKPPNEKKPFSVVKAKMVDSFGEYCGFEQHCWGSEEKRIKDCRALMERYAPGLVFQFSNIKLVRPANTSNEFYSVMQVIKAATGLTGMINNLTVKPVLSGTEEEKSVATLAISRMSLSDLAKMEGGRIVDITAIVLDVTQMSKKPGPDFSIMVADDTDMKYKCNVWEANKAIDYKACIGAITSINDLYVGKHVKANQLKEFSASPHTNFIILPATYPSPRVVKLEALREEIMKNEQTTANVVEYTRAEAVDHSIGEAIEIDIAMLSLLSNPNYTCQESVFQLPIVTIEMSCNMTEKDNLFTKDGTRLFPSLTLRDHTGSMDVRCTEKVALMMSQQEDGEKFAEAFEAGDLKFSRGAVRILRQIQKPDDAESQGSKTVYVNMLIVAAERRFCFGSKVNHSLALHKSGPNVMLASLQQLRMNTMNEFVITNEKGEEILATHVLVLLKIPNSRNACLTEQHNDGHRIRHKGVICVAGEEPFPTSIETFTVTSLARVQDYMISKVKPSLCLVTSATVDHEHKILELFISEVYTMDQYSIEETQALRLFRHEMSTAMLSHLKSSKKRRNELSPEDYDILFTPTQSNPQKSLDYVSQLSDFSS